MNDKLVRHLENCRRGIAKDGNWLWVVNTKTGLMSMRNALLHCCEMSWRRASKPLWQTIAPKIPDVFMFTFVRNPWDRVVSAFHCLQDHPGRFGRRWRKEGGVRLSRDFRAYVLKALKDDQKSIHFQPQTRTFMCDGEFIPNMFIGRFEQLARDWAVVADRIGVPKHLPHVNKSTHRPYQELYDKESRQVVADVYAEEIEALGYEF